MDSRKINYRTVIISAALLLIPLLLVTILYPYLPVLEVPRIGLNGAYVKTLDKHVYYLLAFVPIILYYRYR